MSAVPSRRTPSDQGGGHGPAAGGEAIERSGSSPEVGEEQSKTHGRAAVSTERGGERMLKKGSALARLAIGVAAIAVIAAACSSSGSSAAPSGAGGTAAKYTIGFSNGGGVGNGWREAMHLLGQGPGRKATATSPSVTDHPSRHRRGRPAGRHPDLIAKGVNAIVFNPNDPDALNPAHRRGASTAGITVVAVDASVTAPGAYNLSNDQVAVRLPRRQVAVRAARRQGRRRLHARHRRPPGRHRPRHGLQEGARRVPRHQGRPRRVATKWDPATGTAADQRLHVAAARKFDGIWTSGIDS